MSELFNHLKSRSSTSIKSARTDEKNEVAARFLTSPSDWGVVLNGGRRGAMYGPAAILSSFEKLSLRNTNFSYSVKQVSDPHMEMSDFDDAQNWQSKQISALVSWDKEQVVHLGGGHDHAFPLLASLLEKYDNIFVINLDAHLDTRNDPLHHSGTPFRQAMELSKKIKKNLFVLQVGIHDYANLNGHLEGIDSTNMKIVTRNDCDGVEGLEDIVKECPWDKEKTCLFLSIDCDGLDGSFMRAVSAVNHDGLSKSFLNTLAQSAKSTGFLNTVLGIYEYNPLYEDLSCAGSRYLASLCFNWLES